MRNLRSIVQDEIILGKFYRIMYPCDRALRRPFIMCPDDIILVVEVKHQPLPFNLLVKFIFRDSIGQLEFREQDGYHRTMNFSEYFQLITTEEDL